jgi:hypothetical protein
MQLFSIEQQKSQPLEAHAAAFSTVKVCVGNSGSSASRLEQRLLSSSSSSVGRWHTSLATITQQVFNYRIYAPLGYGHLTVHI